MTAPLTLTKLKNKNFFAAGLHFLSFLVVLIFYTATKGSHSRSSFKFYRNTIADSADGTCSTVVPFVQPSQCDVTVGLTKPKEVGQVNLIYGTLAFFAITCVAHIYYGTDGFGSGSYSHAIRQGWNPYRWFEYAASAGVMSILIGLTEGVNDASSLFALLIMTMAMMFNGFSVESLLRGSNKITADTRTSISASTLSGWALFIGIWTIIIYNFSMVVSDVKKKNFTLDGKKVGVPTWIWIIVIMQLVYYALFGLLQRNHIAKRLGNDANYNYLDTENSYLQLSFTAKLSLASGLAYGLIFRTRDCPE